MSKAETGHTFGDERIVEWLNQPREWNYPKDAPYHPRSDKHGGAQCRYFVDDLIHESKAIEAAAQNGEIVYAEDYDVGDPRGLGWNVDLVLGPPAGDVQPPLGGGMAKDTPGEVWLACDAKSIVTEHQKARRNRQRDINSFADIMHTHHEQALTCGILLLNIAERFDSPTRDPDDITEHANIERIIEEIVDLFDSIDRSEGEISANLDGAGLIVVDHTNLPEDIGETELVTREPAPQPGERVHYRTFVQEMADHFETRFLL
ncbi:hypothetical protein [Salinilacihabitans rarus]|uniref:hypothetical protein n=1 Tax=Salinilacihabitans rarus TaxID=2961596 RepID=UPI0020C8B79C|nr:hypothetical protein [Salinilacihabitans rarus]